MKLQVNKSLFLVLISSLITILNGVFQSLVIPKYIGVTQFGYFKLFGFYVGLVGLAHFGFNDGILLRYARYRYDDLPKKRFRTFFFWLLLTQILFAIVMGSVFGIFSSDFNKKVIYLMIAINVILINMATFFAFICQITGKFNLFSINTILQNILTIFLQLILIILDVFNYFPFIIVQTFVNLIILLKYVIELKDIVVGEKESIYLLKNEVIANYKKGFFVLIGNFMGLIILGLDRIFIEHSLSIEEFSYYSFAISLMGLAFTFITSVSTYLYPYIARDSGQFSAQHYQYFSFLCIIIASYSLCSFFLIKFIVFRFLQDYLKALVISGVLYPTIILRSMINIVCINFYKALQLVRDYNNNNIMAFIIALLINIIVVLWSPSLLNYSIGTLISFYLWMLFTDFYFHRKLKVKMIKNHLFIILVIISFYFCVTLPIIIGFFIYILIVSVFVFMFYWRLILNLKKEYN
jgi:O-antigen/teichoic acid export membrane protein